jgi:hypothetical protein
MSRHNCETKNEKERERVRNKKKSLNTLKLLIQQFQEDGGEIDFDVERKRWTEYYTLAKTVDLIQQLEHVWTLQQSRKPK